jgi:hypothetical protein
VIERSSALSDQLLLEQELGNLENGDGDGQKTDAA